MSSGTALALLLAFSAPAADPDPRVDLVELQLKHDPRGALQEVEAELEADRKAAERLGLEYLRGHLLLVLDRRSEAFEAFANAMNGTPALGPYGRLRLAVEQEKDGHPEVAAGLVATLLGSNPPRRLVSPAAELLRRTLAAGGDCRLLKGPLAQRFRTPDQRELRLAEADCLRRGGDLEAAKRRLADLLEADRSDEVARLAAAQLARHVSPEERSARCEMLIGLGFYEHREFDRALVHLGRAFADLPAPGISGREVFEGRYAIARSHFWEGRFGRAAAIYSELAAETRDPRRKAQALYQEARSNELAGAWERAIARFRETYDADPRGRYSNAALVAYLRLRWLRGEEEVALEVFDEMAAKRRNSTVARAALFLASSELVRDRGERAGAWLETAERLGGLAEREEDYWRGRWEETRGRLDRALERYLEVLADDPYHPLAEAARRRLASPALAPLARRSGLRLAASERTDELYRAWLLLGSREAKGRFAREQLEARLAEGPTAAFLDLEPIATANWPLWQGSLTQAEEMLLALGIWGEGAPAVLRHFPVTEPDLAFTGSLILSQAGEVNRSLYVAEILQKRVPERLPIDLLPESYRRLLYPFRYSYLILSEAQRREVEPYLLAAIIREESRFDPDAFSAASARGLTQFVLPTAHRVAADNGLTDFAAEDLHRPEVSIALGAAYLEELFERYGGRAEPAVAAYNAGEPQAELWKRYCLSEEPEEYLAKVAFRETRGYLAKVLTSRAHYRELYDPKSPPK